MDNYFAPNLKFLREKDGLKQEDLAKIVGKDRSLIARWEIGNREATVDDLMKLSDHFNIPLHDLITKDLRLESDKNNYSILDETLFSKAKELTDDEKKAVITVMNAIKKDIDNKK